MALLKAAIIITMKALDVGYRIKSVNKLDSSRIEVAGGREKISQSLLRTAKKKHSDESVRCNPHSGHKSNQKRYSGEVLYDDELKEYKVRSHSQPHSLGNKSHKTYKNYSLQNDVSRYGAPRRISPTSPQDEISQGIEQESNIKNKSDQNSANKLSPKINVESYDELQVNIDNDMQVSSGENTSNSSQQQSPSARIARVIGNLPIAEYDGSPRRYGPRPGYPHRISKSDLNNADKNFHDTAAHADSQPNQSNETSDGEFFSRSKVNAKQANGDIHNDTIDQRNDIAGSYDHEFSENTNSGDYSDELEYRLYRLNSDNYIGKRLAQSVANSVSNDSPKKSDSIRSLEHSNHLNENSDYRLEEVEENDVSECGLYNMLTNDRNLLLHDRMKQHNILSDMMNHDHDRETMSNPDTEDLGETEIGEQVGHSRNFTLSPETTDCDSNDLESELSVDMNETCSLEHSSNSRLYNSMPILEDGLSSGNVSEVEENCDMDIDGLSNGNNSSPSHYSDPSAMNKRLVSENPTVILMKKQINEIEKEIARHSQKPDNSPASSRAEYSDSETYLHEGDSNSNDSHILSDTACAVNREFLKHLGKNCLCMSFSMPYAVFLSYIFCASQMSLYAARFKNFLVLNANYLVQIPLEQECFAISPAETSHGSEDTSGSESVSQAIREIKEAIQISRNVILKTPPMEKSEENETEPVWIPR
ncbi:hypothetical protein GQR58_001984 [Nymphon striatum]|nr:hypothetical protein GQR58_001984 [Nymphon striatum]